MPFEFRQTSQSPHTVVGCGVTLGGTIGEIAGTGIRIGHMGHVNAPTVFGALGAIETGLAVLGAAGASGGLTAAPGFLAEAVARERAVETVRA